MKSLVIYSSRTGNTKKIAEAAAGALADADLFAVHDMPEDLAAYGLVFIGFWAFRRGADMESRAALGRLHGKKVALLATAGAYPTSEAAQKYLANSAALLAEDNEYLGGFLSQGRVHSFHESRRSPHAEEVHPLTEERRIRLEEAEKHPNEEDCAAAAAFAREMEKKALGAGD